MASTDTACNVVHVGLVSTTTKSQIVQDNTQEDIQANMQEVSHKDRKDDNKFELSKYVVAGVAIVFISILFLQAFSYYYYFLSDDGYRYCRCVNFAVTGFIMVRSIVTQRNRENPTKLNSKQNTIQSQKANIILLFMGGVYFTTLGSIVFFKPRWLQQSLFYFAYGIGLMLVGTHFIVGLKWGKISKDNNYNRLSPNWWACIYLIISFVNFMQLFVVRPWFEYEAFLELNNDFKHVTGEFVHVMIMYCCRPSLTVMAFRCIEQIMHQLLHHNHDEKHESVQMEINIADDCVDEIKLRLITFSHIKGKELIMWTPYILVVVVLDLVTLNTENTDVDSKIDFLIWGFVFGLQCIWTLYIIKILNNFHKEQANNIDIKNVISKHSALFVSSVGVIIAIIGTLGVNHSNWTAWIDYIVAIIYVVLQVVVLILLDEIKVSSDALKEMSWTIKSYGKVIVILHIITIIHAFLGEAYHLEETLDEEEEHNPDDTFAALAFIFFFWSIEFHLACIERIRLTLHA